jgi:hypothetical protein
VLVHYRCDENPPTLHLVENAEWKTRNKPPADIESLDAISLGKLLDAARHLFDCI